jgi:hypothetical protein
MTQKLSRHINYVIFMYGMRWKELYKFEKMQREQLEKDLQTKRQQLEAELELMYDDYRAQKIREG